MAASDPREPSCTHDPGQPASVCRVCKDGPELKAWIDYWRTHQPPLQQQPTPWAEQ